MYAYTTAVRGLDGQHSPIPCEVLEVGESTRDATGAPWTKVVVFTPGFDSPARLVVDSRTLFEDAGGRRPAVSAAGGVSIRVIPLDNYEQATGWAARLHAHDSRLRVGSRDAQFGRQVHFIKHGEHALKVQQDPHRVLTQSLDRPSRQQLDLVRALQRAGLLACERSARLAASAVIESGVVTAASQVAKGSRWMNTSDSSRCAVVEDVESESVTVRVFPVHDEYQYLAETGRTSDLMTMARDEFLRVYAALPAPEVVQGYGDGTNGLDRKLVYGRYRDDPALYFVTVYDAAGIPAFKETGVPQARLAEALGEEAARAVVDGRGVSMQEMPFKNYRELRFKGMTMEEATLAEMTIAAVGCGDGSPSPF